MEHDKDHCDDPNCSLHDPEKFKRFHEAVETGRAAGYIKVHFGKTNKGIKELGMNGESVWAKPLPNNQAKLDNIPFFATGASLNDIVETDPKDADDFIREYVKTITPMTKVIRMIYDSPEDKEGAQALYDKIREALKKNDRLYTENMQAGVMAVAYSIELTEKTATKFIRSAMEDIGVKYEIFS